MPPTSEDRLKDILDRVYLIERVTSGMAPDQFAEDEVVRGAVERFLAIICEASLRLPDNVKILAPHINWRRMNDFGNHLRHAYHLTDADEVWQIVQIDLPPLKAFVESVIRE